MPTASTGKLTLSGLATVAQYQAALRSITYTNGSENPSAATRTVSFTVNDGALNSTTATRTLTVTAVNDAPVVATTGGSSSYTENGSAVAVDNGLTVSDVDSTNLNGATVQITGNYANGQDTLSFTNQNGISGSWNASTSPKQIAGSRMSWQSSAMITAFGCFSTRAKSARVRLSPSPSMMMPRATGNPMVVNADPMGTSCLTPSRQASVNNS